MVNHLFINYAHRGASEYYPENTLSAFYAGVEMGANGVETDIHRTKDGVLVLFHDDDIARVTNGTGQVSDYTYRQLLELDVHNAAKTRTDKICTFQDFLKYFGDKDLVFAIELKQDGVEKETIDMLEACHMRERTILTSFNFESLKNAKAYAPQYRVGYLYKDDEPDPVGKMRTIGGEELCPIASSLTPELTRQFHEMGFSVRAWGIYNEELMRHVYRCGADGMTVNFPDKLTQYLKEQQG